MHAAPCHMQYEGHRPMYKSKNILEPKPEAFTGDLCTYGHENRQQDTLLSDIGRAENKYARGP